MKANRLSDLMPDYKFDTEELSQIKGGGPTVPTTPDNKPDGPLPPHVCGSNLCASNRDSHIHECATSSCLNQA